MRKFVQVVCCTECDWVGTMSASSADSAMFLNYDNLCPQCGLVNSSFSLNFYQKVMVRVDESVWWNPLTWGAHRLEEKE